MTDNDSELLPSVSEGRHALRTTVADDLASLRGTDSLDRLARAFESSARRWELIVYPALFAFIVLADILFSID